MPAHISSSTTPAPRAASRAASHDTGATIGTHLRVSGVSVSYPDRRVLTDISFTAREGDRLGLVGENGTGKSTLLRVISGAQAPDHGTIELPGSVGLLEQQLPHADGTTIGEVLDEAQQVALDALNELEAIASQFAASPDDDRVATAYASALERAERIGAWQAEAARGDTVSGLGLGGLAESRQIGSLSGGQRLRLALASVLLRAPHTLLLDEPSNHLDDPSAVYLERVLREWPGIVIVASHDRALLDAVATKILDLDPLPLGARELEEESNEDPGSGFGVRLWGVGYSAARAERAEEMRRWHERYKTESEQQEALTHEIEVGSREVNRKHESKSESRITKKFYADKDARVTSRRARNAGVRLEALERRRVRRPPEPLKFRGFEMSATARQAAVSAERVALPGRLAETSLEVGAGERLLLTGPNGAGKSTLLAILAGVLRPETGTVSRRGRIGYLPQEVTFADDSRSSSETYRLAIGHERADELPLEHIGLIAHRDAEKPLASLSVGQRRRLALAVLVATSPPVLLLDEPTNHLSLALVEELEAALQDYQGALIVASHDRWLRARWRGEVRQIG